MPNMTNLIEEAITDYWGKRCPDYIDGCPVCEAWNQYDSMHKEYYKRLSTLIEGLEKITDGRAYDRYDQERI